MQEKFNLIIPCAGTGQRFKSSVPKQFFEVNNKTILEKHALNPGIILFVSISC